MRGLNNSFQYPVAKLLEKLKANRDQHIKDYEEAVGVYQKVVQEELKSMLAQATAGKEIDHRINLRKPESHVSEYDQAITMLEMTSETEIELDGNTFAKLVMDQWDWQHTFTHNTKAFNGITPGAYTTVRAY